MPFINSRVNIPIQTEQERQLKSMLGKAIELVPGKSEQYLLLTFEENCHIYLKGDGTQPVAYIEACIFGNEAHCGYGEFTSAVCQIFHKVMHIEEDHIYIRYADIPDWGVANMNFDRNQYR